MNSNRYVFNWLFAARAVDSLRPSSDNVLRIMNERYGKDRQQVLRQKLQTPEMQGLMKETAKSIETAAKLKSVLESYEDN